MGVDLNDAERPVRRYELRADGVTVSIDPVVVQRFRARFYRRLAKTIAFGAVITGAAASWFLQ